MLSFKYYLNIKSNILAMRLCHLRIGSKDYSHVISNTRGYILIRPSGNWSCFRVRISTFQCSFMLIVINQCVCRTRSLLFSSWRLFSTYKTLVLSCLLLVNIFRINLKVSFLRYLVLGYLTEVYKAYPNFTSMWERGKMKDLGWIDVVISFIMRPGKCQVCYKWVLLLIVC